MWKCCVSLLTIGFLFSTQSRATVTISASGQSTSVVSTGSTSPTLYFSNVAVDDGAAGGNYIPNASGVGCSTIINPNCRNITDSLTVTGATDAAQSGKSAYLIVGSNAVTNGDSLSGNAGQLATAVVSATGSITFAATTFAALCTKAALNGVAVDNFCVTTPSTLGATMNLSVAVDITGEGSFSAADDSTTILFKIKSSIPKNSSATNQIGLHQFTAYPGDQKIHIKNISQDVSIPGTENTIGVQKVRFYFVAGPATCSMSAADVATFGTVTNSTGVSYFETGITIAGPDETFIKPLTNGSNYYVRAALVDNAGNIGYLTPSEDDSCGHTAKPDEVVGLLSKNCFIATAAYGSPLAPQVEILRNFRDRFLLKSPKGRAFVNWYYSHSPTWAAKIEDRPYLRAGVRAALYPVVGFSFLALRFGGTNASLLFVTLLMLPLLIYRKRQHDKN